MASSWGTSWGTSWANSWGTVTPAPAPDIPMGGAGYPVDWQTKRRKRTLQEQPEKHLRHILDTVVAEYYGEIIESDLPKSVKAEAADIVRPFAENRGARIPKVARVDWEALQRNADAVGSIIRLWNEEVARQDVDDDDDELFMMMH